MAETGQIHGQIVMLARRAPAGRLRKNLRVLEVTSATLMGQLVWDGSERRNHRAARQYFDHAITAAQATKDPTGMGRALLRKSYVALYSERDPHSALALTEHTAATTGATSHVLTGLALLHSAEAHAMLGDQSSCEFALSRAGTEFDKINPSDTARHLFSPHHFDRMAGSCYLALGKHRQAQTALEQAAHGIKRRNKSGAIILGNLSLCHLRQGNLDLATRTLHDAMDVFRSRP